MPDGLWQAAATYATPSFPNAGFAFADMHMTLLEAATADKDALERRVSALIGMIEAGMLAAGSVVPAICRVALAFADEDYADCVRTLEPVASEVVRVGGSGAQRELMDDMLLLALMRSGDAIKAGVLLDAVARRRIRVEPPPSVATRCGSSA